MNKREKKLSENRANFNFRGIAVDKSKGSETIWFVCISHQQVSTY